MRDPGIPKLLSWRWAPCAALVIGALFFVGFTLLAIPERIGDPSAASNSSRFGSHLTRAPGSVDLSGDRSSSAANDEADSPVASPAAHLASRGSHTFPKRGFTPPLDRPAEAAAPPPAPPPAAPPPPPAEAAPPPAPAAPPAPPETPAQEPAAPVPAPAQ